jgi:MerR family mercuric resistance operon transcriptional regulator
MRGHSTIGAFAKSVNVPVSTLRYYERLGLLSPEYRSDGNYRMYGPAALERIDFIRCARDAGFTLDDVAALLGIRNGRAACNDVRELIEHRLLDLDKRARDLRRFKRTLTGLQRACRNSANRDHCLVIDELGKAH